MKILLMSRFYLNGQTTHVLELCSELLKLKQQPFLVIGRLSHAGYIRWLQSKRIPFSPKIDFDFLSRLIENQGFSVIHTHSAHTLRLALKLGNLFNIPVAATCHYLDFSPLELLAEADGIITISEEMERTLALPKAKTVVIENGIDTRRFRPQPKHKSPKLSALLITRMTDAKKQNYENLVPILQAHDWEVRSIGNWRPKRLGIRYLPWQIDLAKAIGTADLVVGTGRVIREAMAAGCCALVLGNHLDGLVTPENVKELGWSNFSGRCRKQTADALNLNREIRALNSEAIAKLQNFGAHYARQNFSQQESARRTLDLYRTLGERKRET